MDLLVERGFVRRFRGRTDRRQVFVRLRPGGEKILRELSLYHLAELRLVGPDLVKILQQLIPGANAAMKLEDPETRRTLVLSLAGAESSWLRTEG